MDTLDTTFVYICSINHDLCSFDTPHITRILLWHSRFPKFTRIGEIIKKYLWVDTQQKAVSQNTQILTYYFSSHHSFSFRTWTQNSFINNVSVGYFQLYFLIEIITFDEKVQLNNGARYLIDSKLRSTLF